MIIILTQCFPPRIGGIENLLENLSIELSKTHKTLVIADQHDKIKDRLKTNIIELIYLQIPLNPILVEKRM